MPYPIVKADLEAKLGAGEVQKYSRNADANVDEAIAGAWDAFKSAARNIFTAASIDALTANTLPAEAKMHIVGHACAILAAGNNRPEWLDALATEAAKWRGYLVGDTVRCFDDILTRSDTESGGDAGVYYKAPARKFDRSENDYFGIPRRT